MKNSIPMLIVVSIIAIIGIGLLGDAAPTGLAVAQDCVDSDNGGDNTLEKQIFEKGTTTQQRRWGKPRIREDQCKNEEKVREYYCRRGRIQGKTVSCPQGTYCQDGACAEPTIGPVPPSPEDKCKATYGAENLQCEYGSGGGARRLCKKNAERQFKSCLQTAAEPVVTIPTTAVCMQRNEEEMAAAKMRYNFELEAANDRFLGCIAERPIESKLIEQDISPMKFIEAASSDLCKFLDKGPCVSALALYEYPEIGGIIAGVETYTQRFTNAEAIKGLMEQFGQDTVDIDIEEMDGHYVYVFNSEGPRESIAIAWYSGREVIAIEFEDVPEEMSVLPIINMVTAYLRKFPSDLRPAPPEESFRKAYWQCQDGYESYEGGATSCKSPATWNSYAKRDCQDRCNEKTRKCGVKEFSLSVPCPLPTSQEKFAIAGIEGWKDSFAPYEDVFLIIKGVEPDGTPAEPGEGFNVQFYLTQQDKNFAAGNAEYEGGYWYVRFRAPPFPGEYDLQVDLYCSPVEALCDKRYGFAAHVEDRRTFVIKEGLIPELPEYCQDLEMVWYIDDEAAARFYYDFVNDQCERFRCLTDKEISPLCYNQEECFNNCGGECIPIPSAANECELTEPGPPSCNDFDICTTDSFVDGRCSFEKIKPCCGNLLCEGEEDEDSCRIDCARVIGI